MSFKLLTLELSLQTLESLACNSCLRPLVSSEALTRSLCTFSSSVIFLEQQPLSVSSSLTALESIPLESILLEWKDSVEVEILCACIFGEKSRIVDFLI